MSPFGKVAVVSGGLLVGAGLVLGAVAASPWSAAEERCPTERCNDADARADADTASVAAALSTGFIIGGVGTAGLGIALIVVAPDESPPGASVRGARLTFVEAF